MWLQCGWSSDSRRADTSEDVRAWLRQENGSRSSGCCRRPGTYDTSECHGSHICLFSRDICRPTIDGRIATRNCTQYYLSDRQLLLLQGETPNQGDEREILMEGKTH